MQAERAELEDRLAMKDLEVERLRTELEAAFREEVHDSDPARLRRAQQRASDLEATVAAKEVGSPHSPPIEESPLFSNGQISGLACHCCSVPTGTIHHAEACMTVTFPSLGAMTHILLSVFKHCRFLAAL